MDPWSLSEMSKELARVEASGSSEGQAAAEASIHEAHKVNVMSAVRNNIGPRGYVDYIRLVFDPNSFVSTARNIYTTALLLKEGKLILSAGTGGEIVIRLGPLPEAARALQGTDENSLFLLDLSPREWKKLVRGLQIETPMIAPSPTHKEE